MMVSTRERLREASMEPWHFSHGEWLQVDHHRTNNHASMEPWHFSHGEPQAHADASTP